MTALLALGGAALAAGVVQGALAFQAARLRKSFYGTLGPIVRIATPCRIVAGHALVPGAIGLSPMGLAWRGLAGLQGAARFDAIKRLETDARLRSGRRFLRSEALRVTLESGETLEIVLTKSHAWEWRRALGEWVGAKGSINADASVPRH